MKKICLFVLILFLGRFGFADTKPFNAFDEGAMNIMAIYYSGKSPEQLAQLIAPTPKDVPALTKHLKQLGPLTFDRIEEGFSISAQGEKVKVDLRRIHDNIVTIDGQQFTRDTSRPLWPQIEKFMKERTKDKKTVLYQLFVPKAEAQIPLLFTLIRGGLAFVGLSAGYKLVDYYGNTALDVVNYGACSFAENHMTSFYSSPPVCKSYKDMKVDTLKKQREASLAPGQTNILIKVTNTQCPADNVNKSYFSTMQLLEQKKLDDNQTLSEQWFSISGVGKDGMIDTIKIRRLGASTDEAVLKVDPKAFQVLMMTIPNPNPSTKGISPTTIDIDPSTIGGINDPNTLAVAKLNQQVASRIVKELIFCDRKNDQIKASEAILTGTTSSKDGQK